MGTKRHRDGRIVVDDLLFVARLQAGTLAIDRTRLDLCSVAAGVGRTSPPDASPAADDDVPLQFVQRAFHPSPLPLGAEVALDQRLQGDTEGVEGGADAGEHQRDREQFLADRVDRVDLAEAGKRMPDVGSPLPFASIENPLSDPVTAAK